MEEPKGNGINPEGWQGNHTTTRRSYLFALPLCRKLLVGWCGGCPPYLCWLFVLFLIHFNQRKDTKTGMGKGLGVFGMLSLIRKKLFKCERALRGKFKVF